MTTTATQANVQPIAEHDAFRQLLTLFLRMHETVTLAETGDTMEAVQVKYNYTLAVDHVLKAVDLLQLNRDIRGE